MLLLDLVTKALHFPKVSKGCISLLTSWTTEDVIVLHCFQAYMQGMFYSQANSARWDTHTRLLLVLAGNSALFRFLRSYTLLSSRPFLRTFDIPYGGKVLRGRNFRDFRENFFLYKFLADNELNTVPSSRRSSVISTEG